MTLGGAILGLAARYSLPRRGTYGALLLPAVGAETASVVWAVLTWASWRFDGGWIWWVSLIASAVVPVLLGILLGRNRTKADAAMFASLSRA